MRRAHRNYSWSPLGSSERSLSIKLTSARLRHGFLVHGETRVPGTQTEDPDSLVPTLRHKCAAPDFASCPPILGQRFERGRDSG